MRNFSFQLFTDTAHNPVTNQRSTQDRRSVRRLSSLQRGGFGASNEFQVDAISWRSIQNPYGAQTKYLYERGQRSADNLLVNDEKNGSYYQQQQQPHEFYSRERYRRPEPQQIPNNNSKMGRRASSGSSFIDSPSATHRELYSESPDYCSIISDCDYNSDLYNMKAMYKTNFLTDSSSEMMTPSSTTASYSNTAGCRLSLDMNGRLDSATKNSSSSSIYADDGSLCDSATTLIDIHDTALNRIRRDTQKKEEFLRMPIQNHVLQQREFYGQPKKLESNWPPNHNDFKSSKPTHQNFIRVKNDIENERDLKQQIGNSLIAEQKNVQSPTVKTSTPCNNKMFEASTPPEMFDGVAEMSSSEERR